MKLIIFLISATFIFFIMFAFSSSERASVCEEKGGTMVETFNGFKCAKLEVIK